MYNYQTQRPRIFTEDGVKLLTRIRDNTNRLLNLAGAVRWSNACTGGGDSWDMLACMDYMVEQGEIREITGPNVCGQDRVFVKAAS